MRYTLIFITVSIFITNADSSIIPMKNGNFTNYGPYKMDSKFTEICSGPKSVNQSTYTIDKDAGGIIIHLNVLKPVTVDQLKITVHTVKDSKKNLLWSYKSNKPCQHFAFGFIFTQYLKGSQSCQIEKGSYDVIVNYEESTKMFLGSSFFYGDFYFKILCLAKQGNLICLNTRTVLSKA